MPDSSISVNDSTSTARAIDAITTPNGDFRQVVMLGDRGGYSGRFASFRIPGRAGTTGQKLAAIHNATGSAVVATLTGVSVDLAQTVVKAVTVLPPLVRLSRFTALPTNGSAGTKSPEDTAVSSSASVTLWQDASAEGTSSGTALAITPVSGITQEFAPRYMGGAGTNPLYEPADRLEFLESGEINLRPLEGVVVELVYTLATQNPVTDMWAVSMRWTEWTP
jgi:hypothetical protein